MVTVNFIRGITDNSVLSGLSNYSLGKARRLTVYLRCLAYLSCLAAPSLMAEIKFEDVTADLGLSAVGEGKTSGAAWRDFNGDGLPDLWLSNHDSKPNLYLNRDGQKFADVIDQVWSGDGAVDTHGAAWADFDNDGDPDLFELAGGGSGTGSVANHFYVNQNGMLVNQAEAAGLTLARGRGRTPLWLDVDRDGLLDVLAVNVHNPNNEAPTSIFRQKNGVFENANALWNFDGAAPSKWSKILDMLVNATNLEFGKPKYFNGIGFAQLANLTPDNDLELMLFNWPARTFEITREGLEQYSKVEFPIGYTAEDAAIEDFNGDGIMDFFFAAGTENTSGAQQISKSLLGLRLIKGDSNNLSMSFRNSEEITLSVTPYWANAKNIVLGQQQVPLQKLAAILSSSNPDVLGKPTETKPGAISVFYDQNQSRWFVEKHGAISQEVAIAINAAQTFEGFQVSGMPKHPVTNSMLMLSQPDGSHSKLAIPAASPAHSVAAGDYDNDGDIDLFVVRADQIKNLSDVVLTNNGSGTFEAYEVNPGYNKGRGDSATTADYNQDGFLDVYVTNGMWPAPFPTITSGKLYRNQGNTNNWLKLDLKGTQSNRDAVGALVILQAGDFTQIRQQGGGVHASSQNDRIIHFGLGLNKSVSEIIVHWPNGRTQKIEHTAANQLLTLIEPKGN